MSVDALTLLFFDAPCLIAAAGSPSGGSSFLLWLCRRGLLRGAVSQQVLLEAERNIQSKLKPEALRAYHQLLQTTPLLLVGTPSPDQLRGYNERITAKDAHVVAAASAIHAAFLITLDKQLGEQTNAMGEAVRALSLGAFITTVLPGHVDYPSIR